MYNTQYFINLAKEKLDNKKTLVVVAPHDIDTLSAVDKAHKLDMINVILVGDEKKIKELSSDNNIDISKMDIVNSTSLDEAANISAKLVCEKKGDILMKGLIDTSILFKSILKKEYNIRNNNILSHVGVMYKENSSKYFLLTDGGINISPSLEDKKKLIDNAVKLSHVLGNENPKVALICAKEKEYEKIPSTIDAVNLQKMNKDGVINGCVVSGPLQLDNAISKQAADIKNIDDPVAGSADILLVSNIEVGNVLAKGLKYLGGFNFSGVVMGANVPIVMVSRSDEADEKLVSISLACLL